jgi:hypothetical protein
MSSKNESPVMSITTWMYQKAELCAFVTGTTISLATPAWEIATKVIVAFLVGAASTLGAHVIKSVFSKKSNNTKTHE